MNRFVIGFWVFAFTQVVFSQGFSDQQTESIASFLSLDPSQKAKVFQIYKGLEDKKNKQREELNARKPSKETLMAREKSIKESASLKRPEPSNSSRGERKGTPVSEIVLHIAFNQAQKNSSIQKELEAVFTPDQYNKWMTLSGM